MDAQREGEPLRVGLEALDARVERLLEVVGQVVLGQLVRQRPHAVVETDHVLFDQVLQQIAIAYTRIGMTEEAARTYRAVLQNDPKASGAHYGLAFLLLREGKPEEATKHLRTFLEVAPRTAEASRHIEHARKTLRELADSPEPE